MFEKVAEQGYKRCPECFEIVPFRVRICPACRSYQDWRRFVAIGQTNVALLVAVLSLLTAVLSLAAPIWKPRGSAISFLLESSQFASDPPSATVIARNNGQTGRTSDPPSATFIARNDGQTGGASDPPSATFIARNDGQTGGMLRLISFSVHQDDETYWVKPIRPPLYSVKHDGTFIEANKESQFTVQVLNTDPDLCNRVNRTVVITKKDAEKDLITAVRRAAKELACEFYGSQTSFYFANKEITKKVDCYNIDWVRGCLFKMALGEK